MSFGDLETGRHKSGHSQPKQRKDEDSSFERHIKANIQEMQESSRLAVEQLDRSNRTGLSKRMGESLDKSLERSRDLAQETEQLFRDWTVHLAGEPTERHRKKFSYDKLEKVFREEVTHLKDAGRRAIAAHQEALSAAGRQTGPLECRSMVEAEGALSDEEHGLLDDSPEVSTIGQDLAIENRIAHEREEGIRRIQSQVSEVNQIFRDLASIVNDQGHQFQTIEQQAADSSDNTKQAVRELKKTADRQRSQRERLCCMLAAAILVLCFVLLPHMRAGTS